jgi:hypothetical protein
LADDAINWAVLFNSDATKDGTAFSELIDPLLHKTADEIEDWPEIDLFSRLAVSNKVERFFKNQGCSRILGAKAGIEPVGTGALS